MRGSTWRLQQHHFSFSQSLSTSGISRMATMLLKEEDEGKISKMLDNDHRRRETGDRRQETGDRRQETGDRRQETGRQETGDRRQERETGDRVTHDETSNGKGCPPYIKKALFPILGSRLMWRGGCCYWHWFSFALGGSLEASWQKN